MSNKYVKTTFDGLVKDMKSGACLNTDNAKLAAYKIQKKQMSQTKTNEEKINKLENDIDEIKSMLQQLLKR